MNNGEENNERKSLAGLAVRLVILLAIAGGVIFFLTQFRLENIEIRPGSHYTAEEIRDRLFTKKTDRYSVLFYFRITKLDVPELTFVEKVDVELVDRNSVIIEVHDRAITGCVEYMGSYVYFDREGTVVDSSPVLLEGIPVVKGVTFTGFTLGKPVDLGKKGLFEKLLGIIMQLEKNSLAASDITFGIRDDVTLHIGGHTVLLGTGGDYDLKIDNIVPALSVLPEGNYVIDLRAFSGNNSEIDVRPAE